MWLLGTDRALARAVSQRHPHLWLAGCGWPAIGPAPAAPGGRGIADTGVVSEQLYAIPPGRRRRMALALAPVGAVLLAAGVLACGRPGVGWKLVGLVVGLLALVLLGVAWGLRRSAALTEAALAEQRLDEVLTEAAAAAGGAPCGSAGQSCGSGAAEGGCGAACFSRTARTATG